MTRDGMGGMLRDSALRNVMLMRLLGLCPLLAVTTTALGGILLGLASWFTITASGALISLLRFRIARATRLLSFVIVIAVMVGAVGLVFEAFLYEWHRSLGLFIPLIVTNCAILAHAEACASRQPVRRAVREGATDGLGMLLALAAVGVLREVWATGAPHSLWPGPDGQVFFELAWLPPGAFFALAALIAGLRLATRRSGARSE